MSSQLVKVNEKYVYFFNTIESAIQELNNFDDYIIYQYLDCNLFVVGEKNAHLKKRPHFYDWNGCVFPYSRMDSYIIEEWRINFLMNLKEFIIQDSVAA